jgi:DNA-binding GntR family transcriptional regulator
MARTGDRRPTSTARDTVVTELRRRILDLTMAPGSPVAEQEIAAELGISRTPVREALILLAQEGLVRIYPQVGTFVTRIDPAAVSDAQFVREALETASIRDLSVPPAPSGVERLRDILEDQRRAVGRADVDRFFSLDQELHRSIMQLAGHGSAWGVVGAAKAHLDRARRASLPLADTLQRMLDQHTVIVDRIDAGAIAEAEQALRTHLREVFGDIEEIRAQTPDFFDDGTSRPTRSARLA